jgi:hypothetical protein
MGHEEVTEELETKAPEESLEARVHFMDAVPQEELLS